MSDGFHKLMWRIMQLILQIAEGFLKTGSKILLIPQQKPRICRAFAFNAG